MSDVVEKTLSALPSILPGASKLSATSKLGHLVRSITELTSKNAEERLITKELVAIKEQISSPNTTMRQMRELMVRAMYCEMLGYEASFAYIHAIKLAQQGTVLEKRVGYLAVSLFLNESHDLLLLLVNTVLKDLKSTNLIEVCMALTVVSQIFPKDMIPSILPLVEEKLYHQKEIIRRKAVLALYKFYLIAPNQVQHIHNKFRKALCDKDPGVMMCSLHIYMRMIKENPDNYKELTSSFVTILKQVVGGKLPMDFNYHSVPAPWLQIQLLRTLSLLGKEDQSMSEVMYEVLDESLRRAEMNHNISYAILYECVKAIYTIYPKAELLEKAARCIGNLVLSSKINLKYLGLKALTYVVQYDANLALQHQMTIIECLAHTDLTIKKETLELLFRITNALNVIVIVEKILGFLRLCNDNYIIIDLVGKVAELAERYSPDNKWFIQTMNTVFSLGGDFLQPDIPNNFLRLLAEGLDDEDDDRQLKIYAVDSYMAVLKGDCSQLPQRFLQVISSVLGEYSCTSEGLDQREVIVLLKKLLEQRGVSSETRSWVLCALTKLCQSSGSAEMVLELAESLVLSYDTVLRQQSYELQCLSRDMQIHSQVLLQSRDSTQVDWSLSFLDGFVSEALAAGAAPYKPPHQRREELRRQRALSLEPYGLSLPVSMPSSTLTDRQSPNLLSLSSGLSGNSTEPSLRAGVSTLVLEGVKRVWGKDGYLPQKKAPESSALANRLNSVLQSYKQEVAIHASQLESEPKREPPVDQEKQQLASSLFIGLGSQNSSFLLEKAEAPAPRFRRKYKQHRSASSSSTSEASTNSSHSSRQGTDALNDGLLEEESDTRIQISNHTLMCSTLNGSCDAMQSFTTDTYSSLEENVADIIDRPLIKSNTLTKEASVMPQNGCSDITVIQLPSELKDLPHSDVISLTSDQQLSISCCRLYREDAVLLVLFLCNITEMPLRNIFVELSCKELEMASLRGNVMEYLDGRDFSVCHYTLMIEKPHIQLTFRGSVLYQPHSGHSQSLLFSGNISTADFIRPLMLSTEEYGKLWLSSSNDVKQNLKLLTGSRGPLITTLNVFQKILRLHTVRIIGSEGIVACRLLCGAPCLMHCRVHGTSLAVWLRSPLPAFPDCLLYHCQRVLQDL